MALKDTDYMYSCARVRAASGSFTPKERIDKMLEVRDISELFSLISSLSNTNTPISQNHGGMSADASLDSLLGNMVEGVISLAVACVPQPEAIYFLLYQYDCANIKTAVKYLMRGISFIPSDMLFTYGTVSADLISEMMISRDFENSSLPKNMAEAVTPAIEEYMKTKDPRVIDFRLDRACFADIIAGAEKCGSPMLLAMMREKIDYTNILSYLRIVKTFGFGDSIQGSSSLESSILSGGFLDCSFFTDAYETMDFESFIDSLKLTKYKALAEKITTASSVSGYFSEIEKICDDRWLANLYDIRYQAFGVEVIASHIITAEYEAKNLRIIKAGLSSGQSPEKIREKVRTGHV